MLSTLVNLSVSSSSSSSFRLLWDCLYRPTTYNLLPNVSKSFLELRCHAWATHIDNITPSSICTTFWTELFLPFAHLLISNKCIVSSLKDEMQFHIFSDSSSLFLLKVKKTGRLATTTRTMTKLQLKFSSLFG